jgi:hypothetical protein
MERGAAARGNSSPRMNAGDSLPHDVEGKKTCYNL